MKISSVKISNILGVRELEFKPGGSFTEISGRNGAGKSSVLTAIRSAFEGGHDATLLRKGSEKGEIVLVLDDGTHIRKRITNKSSVPTVEKDGVKAASPAAILKAMTDMFSVNPVDFLRAPKKRRVDVLLESVPMTADIGRIEEIVGHKVKPTWQVGAHALEVIEQVYSAVFDDRTGTNRAVREKRATINQLSAAIPDDIKEVDGDLDGLLEQIGTLDEANQAEMTRINGKLATLTRDSVGRIDDIKAKGKAEVDTLMEQVHAVNARMAQEIEAEREAFRKTDSAANAQRQKKTTEYTTARAELSAKVKVIQQDQDSAARIRTTRETIAAMETEAAELDGDAQSQTAALEALEAYKSELLAALPIEGLEVKEGEIFRHGVPYDRLNSAQQVEIAVDIAKLRAGDLGIIAVDGIELLDCDHYEEFKNKIEETGLQMFVARVADRDFTIHTN